MPPDTPTHRTLHTATPVTDPDGKRLKLQNWKRWRRYGLRGRDLEKKTRLDLRQVRKWAKELDFDLEGLA